MNKIASQKLCKEQDGFEFNIDVWYDNTNNEWWFAYADVYQAIDFSRKAAQRHYYSIDENDKCDMIDTNFMGPDGVNIKCERSFINYNALSNLLDRNSRKINAFTKVVNNAVVCGDMYMSDDDFKQMVRDLEESFKSLDYEGIFMKSYELVNSETGRDVLDKLNVIDKDVENALDKVREYMLSEDDINLLLSYEEDESLISVFNSKNNWKFEEFDK